MTGDHSRFPEQTAQYVCSLNTLENFQACSLNMLRNVIVPMRVQGTCLKIAQACSENTSTTFLCVQRTCLSDFQVFSETFANYEVFC